METHDGHQYRTMKNFQVQRLLINWTIWVQQVINCTNIEVKQKVGQNKLSQNPGVRSGVMDELAFPVSLVTSVVKCYSPIPVK